MRRLVFASLIVLFSASAFAQNDSIPARIKPTVSLPRSNDHLMLQLGYNIWQGATDSMPDKGIPRTFNAYFMLDFPFKTSPDWSVALGAGIATDNMYLDKTTMGINGQTTRLKFTDVSDTNHFKKYKVATAFLEVPLELRFSAHNNENRAGFKAAIGAKVGTLLNAHTKGRTLQSSSGSTLNTYTEKLNSKSYFNQNRVALTGRLGYGHFSLFGSYVVTSLFKDGVAPTIHPITIGLTLSGL